MRMLDEDDDVIPPSSFLPTAERLGLIVDIDRLVLAKAIELAGRSQPIAVNVSGASLCDPRLIEDVQAAIADGLNPAWLDFEITETAAISNMDHARTFAQTVTGMGCGLGLDDFGTGFSSFSYLKELPVQHLKIDIEFIRDLPRSRPTSGWSRRWSSSRRRSARRPSPRGSRTPRRWRWCGPTRSTTPRASTSANRPWSTAGEPPPQPEV